ncbi:2-amino-4-hydroxy-6-hydroxymethyldihydropteridine diphosphokinase [Rhizorhapis suberifaciens]|uniref:2-amino-4-hydroxy-6-hydroxymethyldihydropteridine pyrophosphokinase n=1 Tax=Rhizorhapis suberifaciens TaxID=13656 RepID=A0A840HQK7_9SPHN|nr:2-amino-4-hydroxy-6-hydroxymethyldihydropteridine diphosphokinase [Rhizorhapis suberifaciens]MBB4639844.1 2-amino-4-hydroxy-6-hydroxymethyldihydropteridine diphosphokinase [Rhizorhapis suberifaciens]
MHRASYAIGLGSNRPHHRHGSPRGVIIAALQALNRAGLHLRASSPIIENPPIGPSRRRFANAAAIVETEYDPIALLARLKRIERQFGMRTGQRWSARTLDLDIILWSGGIWKHKHLSIPHSAYRERNFVLAPLARIAASWRDPITGLTVQQLHSRVKKPKPVDRKPKPD